MEKELKKYLGCTTEIIYIGAAEQITQRLIEVRAINKGYIKAHCLHRKAPRVFKIENILAIQPTGIG
ncbi:hypothetical protein [Paenibacillus agricola]|uniref:WYL domain-containing protein n=1 Tax=Paenibacillus agricola TaxID=2716264 RepID=A0ABX0JAK5_9BACL|nr:hypothetical protein [Paenibacillus agricola]NHN31209.1 hypothetical protein [Paenibacillus agricola]